MAESFTTTNRYFDNKHYPRGFSRHGDFTIKEAQLLERHGHAFNDLDLGKREPVTEEEKLGGGGGGAGNGCRTRLVQVYDAYQASKTLPHLVWRQAAS